jgi:hypothetical protein
MESLRRQVRGTRAIVLGRQPHPLHLIAAADFARMVSRALTTPDAAGKRLRALSCRGARMPVGDASARTWLSSLPGGECVLTSSCPVVEQFHGRLHAVGEELVGEVVVC